MVVAGIGAAVVRSRRSSSAARTAMEATGCRLDSRFDAGSGDTGNTAFRTDPPAGGPHGPQPARSGTYLKGNVPDDGAVVHALEHGRVAIWFSPQLAPADIDALAGLADVRRGMTLVLARPSLPAGQVAATAWHKRLICPSLQVDALRRFVVSQAGQGPEKQPPD